MKAPPCSVCGEPKLRGTIVLGVSRGMIEFWMCGTLQFDHDEILQQEADIEWEDEDETEDDDLTMVPEAGEDDDALWDDI